MARYVALRKLTLAIDLTFMPQIILLRWEGQHIPVEMQAMNVTLRYGAVLALGFALWISYRLALVFGIRGPASHIFSP
jgi:hypothetical protein